MTISEILRKFADLLDKHGDESGPQYHSPDEEITMVSPQQQEMEMLKKLTGQEDCTCEPDELDTLRMHAGIQIIPVQDQMG